MVSCTGYLNDQIQKESGHVKGSKEDIHSAVISLSQKFGSWKAFFMHHSRSGKCVSGGQDPGFSQRDRLDQGKNTSFPGIDRDRDPSCDGLRADPGNAFSFDYRQSSLGEMKDIPNLVSLRRGSVSAECMRSPGEECPEEDGQGECFPKSPRARDLINTAVSLNLLFKQLDNRQKSDIVTNISHGARIFGVHTVILDR